jgi:tol-pal system protein YbgF
MKSAVQQVQTDLALFKAEAGRRDSARAAQLSEVIRVQQTILDSLQVSNRAVGRLKGDLSTDLYNIQQQLVQLQELTGQSQRRLTELRSQMEAREAQIQATQSATDSASPAPSSTASASQMYEASLKQLQRGSASTARAGFQEMLRAYPASELAPDALYFVGQTFAVEQPDSAAAYYQQVVDRYPTSLRAATALYNLGMLAERAKDNPRARSVYQQVVDKYGGSPEADLARDRLKTLPKR